MTKFYCFIFCGLRYIVEAFHHQPLQISCAKTDNESFEEDHMIASQHAELLNTLFNGIRQRRRLACCICYAGLLNNGCPSRND